jgi:16S rRNA (cytosine967-C5)-methyltransferase
MLKDTWMLAIETLSWMELQNTSERQALAKATKQLNLRDVNSLKLAHRMVYETTRRKNLIDRLLNMILAPRSLNDFDLGIQSFLRLYVFQLKFEECNLKDAIHIANIGRVILGWKVFQEIEETLGKLYGVKMDEIFKNLNDVEKTAYKTFHTPWYVDYCFKTFGRHEALNILEANNKSLPVYIRINTLKGSESIILKKIMSEGIHLEAENGLKYVYKVIKTEKPLVKTRSFNRGLFYIQDKASCYGIETTNAEPGMKVLDVCCSPGAKTTYLAQLMENKGEIYSIDYSRKRISFWKKEIARMGVKIAYPIIADASNLFPLKNTVDLVILDPPCSGTGVFSRIPSHKWRFTKYLLRKMVERQWQMLNHCVELVKEGGLLYYFTCSLTLEENERMIERFLKWHPEFKLTSITQTLGLPGLRGLHQCQRLYPHIHKCNGFFIAKLVKNS